MKIEIPISYNIVRAFGLTLLVTALIPLFTIEECKNSTYFIIIICSYAVITTPTRLLIFFNVLSVSYKCPKCSNLNPISVNFKESVSNSGVNRTSTQSRVSSSASSASVGVQRASSGDGRASAASAASAASGLSNASESSDDAPTFSKDTEALTTKGFAKSDSVEVVAQNIALSPAQADIPGEVEERAGSLA